MDIQNQIELEQLFEYRAGKLFWAVPRRKIRVGQEAGYLRKDGYRVVRVDGKLYLAHRLIWEMHHGPIPEGYTVDHEDTDQSNNRIGNLRLALHEENCRNRRKPSNNSSGYKGVSWSKSAGKYEARIKTNGKQQVLGYFKDPKEAHVAYCNAAKIEHAQFHRTE